MTLSPSLQDPSFAAQTDRSIVAGARAGITQQCGYFVGKLRNEWEHIDINSLMAVNQLHIDYE